MTSESFGPKADIDAWTPISTKELVAFLIISSLALKFCLTGDRWFPVLDAANLMFHEAGHPLIGIFSSQLMVYGGTLGQLAFPSALAIKFYFEKNLIGFAVSLLWLFENLLNISRYMGDARSQLLPLVGGGEHDWTEILGRWHVLEKDAILAKSLAGVAVLGILSTAAWAYTRWLTGQRKAQEE
jgi:hypothetical protein